MPELPDGLTARPLTADDLSAAAELLAAAEPVDDTGEHLDADDLADWWIEDLVDLARDSRAVCTGDGAAGCATAELQVDTENPTGAFGLYRRLGFTPVRTRVQWVCTLQPVP